ncbi:MAG: hypothetical protein ABIY71_12005 [Flavobacteriales bacterium]
MENLRPYAITLALFALGLSSTYAQQQTLSWNWTNTICGDMLNCNTGCSACNQPAGFLPGFYGINAAWLGISTCPQPTTTGDNAVFSEGWSAAPNPLKMVMVAGIATGPMTLDTIVIRHRSADQGPTWLRISLKLDLSKPAVLIYEGPITEGFTSLILPDLGKLDIPAGYTAAGFQLRMQAFGSDGGAWVLDAVRVTASPSTSDDSTGLTELSGKPNGRMEPLYDVLGRPTGDLSGLSISRDGKRRVVVQ